MIRDFIQAAATLLSWWNNPFLVRNFRTEWRDRSPLWAFLGLSALMAAPVGIITIIALATGPHGFPAHWGGSWGGLAFTLLAAVHVPLVLRASMAGRRREWIPLEAKLGTLELILVAPMSRNEIVQKKALYPCCQGMITAFLGLPLYAVCWGCGGFSGWQIVTLYVLFFMISFRPTLKMPHSILASSRRQQVVLGVLLLWGAVVWMALMAPKIRGGWGLFASLPITYPNVLTTWLARPTSFLSFHLPPIALVFCLHALSWGINIRVASAQLETATETTFAAVTRRRFLLIGALVAAALGLAWPSIIGPGDLASVLLVPSAPAEQVLILALAAVVLILVATELIERGATRLSPLTAFSALVRPELSLTARLATGAVHALAAALLLPALALPCLLVVSVAQLQAGLPHLGVATVLLASAFLVSYGIGALMWAWLRTRRRAYSVGSLLATGVLLALPALGMVADVFSLGYLTVMSPFGGFLALQPQWVERLTGSTTGLPVWYVAVMLQVALAIALLIGCHRVLGKEHRPARAKDASPSLHTLRDSTERTHPLAERLIEHAEVRWDNPLVTLGLRQGSRSGALIGIPTLALGLASAAVLGALLIRPDLSGMPVPCIGGAGPPGLARSLEAAAAYIPLLVGLVLALLAATTAGNSWSDDDRRQILGFILSTRLTAQDIALGRFHGLVLPHLIGLGLTFPIALVCGIVSLEPSAIVQVLMSYAWAYAMILTCAHLGLWLGVVRRGGIDSVGMPLAALLILGMCRWWFLGSVHGIATHYYSGLAADLTSAGLYAVYLLVEIGIAFFARRGAIASVERRRLSEPFAN